MTIRPKAELHGARGLAGEQREAKILFRLKRLPAFGFRNRPVENRLTRSRFLFTFAHLFACDWQIDWGRDAPGWNELYRREAPVLSPFCWGRWYPGVSWPTFQSGVAMTATFFCSKYFSRGETTPEDAVG